MKTEIVLLLYNRPEHSKKVIESLIQNGVKKAKAFLDYSDKPEIQINQKIITDYIDSQKKIDIDLFRHKESMGLAKSVKFALNHTFKEADAVILLEDDCVIKPGGIKFFLEGLEKLRGDKNIRSICGYLFPADFNKKEDEVLLLSRFCTWGWATWKESWNDYNEDLEGVVKAFKNRGVMIEDFALDIAKLTKSKNYLEGNVDIWSVNWILEHYLTGTLCAYPNTSVVENIGFDGSGKNSELTEDFGVKNNKNPLKYNWNKIAYYTYNEEVLRQFMKEHGLKTYPYI